ncbi:MAG: glycosyltransferase family 39 protein, partial [Chloroflexi bacterium]|nr:glycosyltransferase family 39 protein [Chloroflexota bacterium]
MKLVAPSHPLRRRACTALLAAGILLMALGLRFWRIDAQSIWYDEGWSIHLAREGLAEALAQIAGPGHTHPPGYYLLLMGWVRLFGDGVLAVRGLSALLGSITVLALVALAREVYGDDRTGLLAAALAALAPAQIVYSQEVRMYALLGLCFVLLLALGSRYTSGEGRWSAWHWGALLLVEIVALYSHYLMAFPLLSLNLWVIGRLLSARRRLVRWLGAQAVALAALLPWLIFALGSLVEHETMGAQPLSLGAFLRETGAFLLGGHIALLGREPLYARFAALAAAALALVTLPLLARRQDKKGTAYLLLQIVLPLLLVFALMRARPGYHPRYVLILLWPMLVLLARGTVRLWAAGAWGRMGALCALGLWLATSSLAATALYTDPYYRRDEARATAVYLRQELPPDALIL